jgi:predicted tellurium resistance membrane protein TerC
MMAGGSLIASMIDRFWWLAYVGSAVIIWTGADMMFEDAVVESVLGHATIMMNAIEGLITAAVLGAAHYVHRHLPAQRRPRQQPGTK